ncbi:MAG: DNA primase [Patescibacteria group bacterium]|nr:DNA primase [Patescibacteria group bacterium]
MSSTTEEIKSRLDIVEVVAEYVKLTQAGSNWKGLCPFHNEKTPSFLVSQERQYWHCFGCGEGGDIFTFIMKIEGLEFYESLKLLAKKAGIEIKQQNIQTINLKNKLLDINELSKKFFHYILQNSHSAENARKYLEKRGIKKETIEKFELGCAPNFWDKSLNFLKSKGYKIEDIFLAGIVVKKDNRYYDRFRDRLIFPINNLHGQTVGFSARALNKEDNAKYINSPQTEIYNKSEILYGLDKAKNSARKKNEIILVEGQMDMVSSHQAGVDNVVATSGTALTKQQIKILKRYSDNLLLVFDEDQAGYNAFRKGSQIAVFSEAFKTGANLKAIYLPDGQDPDDCIRKNPKEWKDAIKKAMPYLEKYIKQALDKFDMDSVEGKKSILNFMKILAIVPSKIEQDYYIKKLSQILGIDEECLREDLENIKEKRANTVVKNEQVVAVKKDGSLKLAEQIIALLLKYPDSASCFKSNLDKEIFISSDLIKIYEKFFDFYKNKKIMGNSEDFIDSFKESNEQLFYFCEEFLLLAEKDFSDFDKKEAKEYIVEHLKKLQKFYIIKQKKILENKIRKAEEQDSEIVDELLQEAFLLDKKLLELE